MISGISGRYVALRKAAGLPGAEPAPLLDAAFTELEAAIEALAELQAGQDGQQPAAAARDRLPGAGSDGAERRLLRAVFTDAPVPLFLLATDGTVQRVNKAAATLLGSRPGYATGRPFTTFVHPGTRAAVHSQLSAVARTGRTRPAGCTLIGASGPIGTGLMIGLAAVRGDADQLIVAVPASTAGPASDRPGAGTANGAACRPETTADGQSSARRKRAAATERPPQPAAVAGRPVEADSGGGAPGDAERAVRAITHRLDLVTAVTRLLLENENFSESMILQRCASLLSSGLAAWVVVDIERRHRLRRQFAIGPSDQTGTALARVVSAVDPVPGTLPSQVHESGQPVLITHPEDLGLLGADSDGVPLLALMEGVSVLSVPLGDGERRYGVLTMARRAAGGQFELADLGLVEELGGQLGLAIRVDRRIRRRTEIADALQASLLPRRLPDIPGVEVAAGYLAATEGVEVGGDFYDVYRTPAGFGLAVGDVCGKGEEAAAVTSAARHAIRVIAHRVAEPERVLSGVNDILLAEDLNGGFVTTNVAHFRWRGSALRGALCSAGHPGPVLVRADGKTELTHGGGLPLGLFADLRTGREEVLLHRGDLLFFFTDGVTEARSPDRACFEDRLVSELAGMAGSQPADVIGAMQRRVLDFSAGNLTDDLTMVALRVGDRP